VLKWTEDFYEAAESLKNHPGAQRLIQSLEDALDLVREEGDNLDGLEKVYRNQGSAQTLNSLIKEFYAAPEAVERIKKNSEGSGPSIEAIT